MQATPTQLVFGRDAILNTKFEADWQHIKPRKQHIINKNNARENSKRIPHEYKNNDKVLIDIRYKTKGKYAMNPYKGPYKIIKVDNNGTVAVQRGAIIIKWVALRC